MSGPCHRCHNVLVRRHAATHLGVRRPAPSGLSPSVELALGVITGLYGLFARTTIKGKLTLLGITVDPGEPSLKQAPALPTLTFRFLSPAAFSLSCSITHPAGQDANTPGDRSAQES